MLFTKNFQQLEAEVQRHVAADQVAQGSYKTCFIGCLAKQKNSPEFIQREYGIPLAVSRIAESIFERLPSDEAPLFFAAFPDAIQCNGKDLNCVGWQFLAAELRSLQPVTPEVQEVIDTVITGIGLLAQGKEWPEEDAWAADWAASAGWAAEAACWADWAAEAAYWAARAAANAAGWADWAAYRTAWAAALAADGDACLATRRRRRDLLLQLIKEAPITQQEDNS